MITRAHIRRQLRASGGITNVVPREGYILGNIVRGIGKGLGKVADVAKQVVKSPIGKAALLGLGASYLGPKIMGGQGLSSFFGKGSFNPLKMAMNPGGREFGLSGLGRLLDKAGMVTSTGGLSGLGKLTGGAGLLTYFMSKGASEEEAKELAKDVYRGKGIGFDQIRADLNKYRSGALSQSQMFDKNYRFLTPRNFVAKDGGSPNMQMAEIPKGLTMEDAVKTFKLSNGRDPKNMQEVIDFFKNRKLSAQGGRIGYSNGSDYDPEDDRDIMEIMRDEYGTWDQHDADYYSKLKKKKSKKKYKRAKAFGGGIGAGMPRIPMGMPRVNAGGIRELDYRQSGGFVPVGVKEKADDVPAMLSKNEFVMTADAVRGAGDGNIKKGAQRMYDLMKRNEGKVA